VVSLVAAFRLEKVIHAIGGQLLHGSSGVRIRRIWTDSRSIRAGDLFVALKGPKFDGHRYVNDALTGGAVGAIVKQSAWHKISSTIRRMASSPSHVPAIVIGVKDPLRAYQDLAAFHRRQFHIPVVAITGSNGKTTTKEMVSHILSKRWRLLKTQGNLNNSIGVPRTLLGLNRGHEAAVIEMGVDQEGQTNRLCEMAQPAFGVITNAGTDHLEFFGSLEGSARAKAELLANLPNDGVVMLNADDNFFHRFSQEASCPVVSFGFSPKADVRASDVVFNRHGTTFRLHLPHRSKGKIIRLRFAGHHNVSNALAGAAVGYAMGLPIDDLAEGLANVRPAPMRSEIRRWKGITFLYDCYNANPDSMKAALTLLANLGHGKRTIAVLGDMRELGANEEQLHRDIGAFVAKQGFTHFIACGRFGPCFVEGAQEGGMSAQAISRARSIPHAARILEKLARPGDMILLKASRGIEIERVLKLMDKGQ
jgi:UDP-N-acetylmuramoyl-tripeptide--D-alanyl-D-alanine ligase